jgi:prepilin-type N-terminal cleavage/methylation domain-containing protein
VLGENLIKNKGFTLIEAIVSLALFAIAFSGLYFFFGMAQQANNNSEKRMHLNLMANHILETIHAEAFRDDADVANPFVTPASYTANLSDCSIYTAPDVRHTWCTELNASVGPHKGVHADEIRTVEVVKDEAYLIANVSLVVDAGIGDKNLIKTFLSRKIAAPRRTTPPEACVENHNEVVAHVKSEMAKCDAATVPFITTSRTTAAGVFEFKLSCPDYIMSGNGFEKTTPGLLGKSIMDPSYRTYLAMTFFQWYVLEKVWIKGDASNKYWEGHTIYGPDYPWTPPGFGYGVAGNIWIAGPSETDTSFCEDKPGIYNAYLPNVKCHMTWPTKPIVNVFSCCPQEKIVSGWGSEDWSTGRYKKCNGAPKSSPPYYVPYMGDGFDFSR